MSKWTIESIQTEASKYQTKKDFKLGARGAYEAAVRKSVLSEVCIHMQPLRTTWSHSKVAEVAKLYNTGRSFCLGASGAYNYALTHNIMDEVCAHMEYDYNRIWNEETILLEAIKYNTRNQFKQGNQSAYAAALSLNVEQAFSHMEYVYNHYSKEELYAEAKKYRYRNDFKRLSYNMYQAAYRLDEYDDICAHMEAKPGRFNFLKPAIMYYFRIEYEGSFLWKIGITNYSVDTRYYKRDFIRMSNHYAWEFDTGAEAFNAEQTVLSQHMDYSYTGPTPFTDGTKGTECFTVDILEGLNFRDCDTDGNPLV